MFVNAPTCKIVPLKSIFELEVFEKSDIVSIVNIDKLFIRVIIAYLK